MPHLFGPDSRAEVPFLARGRRERGAGAPCAGRIDRLVVEPQRVLIVDFKSDANVPQSPDGGASRLPHASSALYAQIAGQLFPGREIEAAILWTSLESLMILPRHCQQAWQLITMG